MGIRDRNQTSRRAGARREALAFYLFLSPWLVGLLVFTAGPMIASMLLSLTDWNSFQPPNWVGLQNYQDLFVDPLFRRSLINTIYFSLVSVPLSLLIALGLANLLSAPIFGRRFFRTVIYLPVLVPLVAAAMIFRWMLAPDTGPVNRALGLFGIDGPAWLLDSSWVIPAVILLSLWQVGNGTILLIAGINSVPREFLESATVDGASKLQQFWRITVPMITPVLFFNLVTGIIGAFQVFSQVYVLTDGTSGPDNASLMLVPYLFTTAFRDYEMGYASALAWVLFAIIFALTVIVVRSSSAWVFYESEVRR